MSVVLLRTLTEKSVIPQGKNAGLKVGEVLDRNKISLIYSYFHYERITYTPDVLDKLRILEEDRITKPGKEPEKFKKYELRNHYLAAQTTARKTYDDENLNTGIVKAVLKKLNKSKARAKYKALIERERIFYSKSTLKARNQNKW